MNSFSNQKRTMRRRTRKPRKLEFRLYAEHMTDLNKYLAIYSVSTSSKKTGKKEL